MITIFVGILLATLSFHMGLVDCFLPALGFLLIYSKLRRYRAVSRSFHLANIAVIVMMCLEAVIVFLMATPLKLSEYVNIGIMVVTMVLQIWFLLCLTKGIQDEFEKKELHQFKGTSAVGFLASKFLFIVFLISDFALGATICLIAMLVFLVGLCRFLTEAGKSLDFVHRKAAPARLDGRVLWVGYILLLAVSISGGIFLGLAGTGQGTPNSGGDTDVVEKLKAKGMPEEVARDLSEKDVDSLKDIRSFVEVKAKDADGGVRLIAGMMDESEYKLILWYANLNGAVDSGSLSREIIEVSRTDYIGKCTGRVYYTRDGKDSYKEISAEKTSPNEGRELISQKKGKEADAVEVVYAEVPLRPSADRVRGYLILNGVFHGQNTNGSIYTELFDAKIIQFPYKNANQIAAAAEEKDSGRNYSFALMYKLK